MEVMLLMCSSAYADDDNRLAAAANGAKLKSLRKKAQRDSKFVKKKLQRQLESGFGSRGSKQKAKGEASQEGDGEQALLRRDSSPGGEQQQDVYAVVLYF